MLNFGGVPFCRGEKSQVKHVKLERNESVLHQRPFCLDGGLAKIQPLIPQKKEQLKRRWWKKNQTYSKYRNVLICLCYELLFFFFFVGFSEASKGNGWKKWVDLVTLHLRVGD